MIVASAISIPAVALGQQPRGDALGALILCRGEADDARRLACFDRAAAVLATARPDERRAPPTPEQRRAEERAAFGLRAGSPPARPADAIPRVDTLDGVATRVVPAGRVGFVVTLADGSVWRTTEPSRIDPAAGDPVHIRRGALGSYLASFNKARSIRIERVR